MLKRINTFIVLSVLSSISLVSALVISPAHLNLTVKSGSSVSGEVNILNEQNIDITYYISVEKFEAAGASGTPTFSGTKEGLPSWVNVVDKIDVKKGEKVKIPFTVTVPKGTATGKEFGSIFFSTLPPGVNNKSSSGSKVGTLIFLNIESSPSTTISPVAINANLKYGDKNNNVYQLQDFLIDKGYLKGSSTGLFGLLTLKAVKNYQKSVGINPTGFVGLATREKINAEIMTEIESSIKAEQQE